MLFSILKQTGPGRNDPLITVPLPDTDDPAVLIDAITKLDLDDSHLLVADPQLTYEQFIALCDRVGFQHNNRAQQSLTSRGGNWRCYYRSGVREVGVTVDAMASFLATQ